MTGVSQEEALLEACRTVIAPLVRADGGVLHLVSLREDELALHLSGTCSGCPGVALTCRGVIEPAIAAVAPEVRVVVTSGAIIPSGATEIGG